MDIKFDILDYLGKYDDGVIVILSILYDGNWYEASFYYKDNIVALTPEDKFESVIGTEIENWEGYNQLMINIIGRVVPYNDIIKQLDDINPDDYDLYLDKGE